MKCVGSNFRVLAEQQQKYASMIWEGEWNATAWPKLLNGERDHHASVTLHLNDSGGESNEDNQDHHNSVVVVGGSNVDPSVTVNSVIFWDPTKLEWKQGPILNGARKDHAVVVCNDAIYVIGGECSELQFMEEEGGGGWCCDHSWEVTSHARRTTVPSQPPN